MIPINKLHLPIAHKKRPRIPLQAVYITVHSTGNPTSTAKNERSWLTNPINKTETGFHYVVDEKEVIECIPPNEVAWHAGDGRGPGNREKTLENAILFIRQLMDTHKISKIRRHYDWSKKNCPRILNISGNWYEWENFLAQIKGGTTKAEKTEYEKAVESFVEWGIISSPDYWKAQKDNNIHALILKTAHVLRSFNKKKP